MRDKKKFSRWNQPVPCKVCGKRTTWSEAHGFGGLDLCRACFDAVSIENEHLDGYHQETPCADCPDCVKEGLVAQKENEKTMTSKKASKATPKKAQKATKTVQVNNRTGEVLNLTTPKAEKVTHTRKATPKEKALAALKAQEATKAAAKAAKKAPKAQPQAEKATEAPEVLKVRYYGQNAGASQFYFSSAAAEKVVAEAMLVKVEGRKVTLTPTKSEEGVKVGRCHAAKVLSVGKVFRQFGLTADTQDLEATLVGKALEVTLQ